jgi:hypothetical protein
VLYIRHSRLTPSRLGHAGRDDGVWVVLLRDRLGGGETSKGSGADGKGGKHGDGVGEDCGVSAICSGREPVFRVECTHSPCYTGRSNETATGGMKRRNLNSEREWMWWLEGKRCPDI